MSKKLSICAWNMRALSSARSYINTLAGMSDVITMSEHRLYKCELHKLNDFLPDFSVYSKASSDLDDQDIMKSPAHCGVLIAWRSTMDSRVSKVKIDSSRIVGIKISGENNGISNIYIFGVYLPHQNCLIDNFGDHLAKLELAICQCSQDGEIIVK